MTYYAFFHHRDLSGTLTEACGDRSVISIDGRLSDRNLHAIAADECKRRGFCAYRIHAGDNLARAVPRGKLVNVERMTNLQTISERINAQRGN